MRIPQALQRPPLPTVLLAVAVFGASWASPLRTPPDTWDAIPTVPQPDHVIAGCALLAALASMLHRKVPHVLPVAAAVGWLACSMWPALVLAGYAAGRTLPDRVARVAAAVAGTALVGVPVGAGAARASGLGQTVLISVLVIALLAWLPLLVGVARSDAAQLAAQRAELAARAEREEHLSTDRAQIRERARIAREMHDVVAHRVSLMVLHAGALEVTATSSDVVRAAGLIRRTGSDALTELRQVLAVLRADPPGAGFEASAATVPAPQPTLSDLDALLDEFRDAGMAVTAGYTPDLAGVLSVTLSRTAYRIVQEGLTNVAKHAGPAGTTVVVRISGNAVHVAVINEPGPELRVSPPPGGHGLTGLRERVTLLGGTLQTAHHPDGGFTLTATLPLGELS